MRMKTNRHNSTSFLNDLIPIPNARYRPIAQINPLDPKSRASWSRAANGLTFPEFSHRYSQAGAASGQSHKVIKINKSIMVTRLQKINSILADQVNDAMFLREAARPSTGRKMLQRLRLSDAGKRLSQNGFN
jgi:hypothetical protein